MVAVTLEKNVAIVVILMYRIVAFSSSFATKVGRTRRVSLVMHRQVHVKGSIPLSEKSLSSSVTSVIEVKFRHCVTTDLACSRFIHKAE